MLANHTIKLFFAIFSLFGLFSSIKFEKSARNFILLKPVLNEQPIDQHLHNVIADSFTKIFEFDLPEELSLAEQLEALRLIDFKRLYQGKSFNIKSREDLMDYIAQIIKKNFRVLATGGSSSNVQNQVYSLVKEYIQYQIYENGLQSDLKLENLYTDITAAVNQQLEVLMNQLKDRLLKMKKIQVQIAHDLPRSNRAFKRMNQSVVRFLLAATKFIPTKLMTSHLVVDPTLLAQEQSKVQDIIFRIRGQLKDIESDESLSILKQPLADLYQMRLKAPIPTHKDLISDIIYQLLAMAPKESQGRLFRDTLRSPEKEDDKKFLRSEELRKFEEFVKQIQTQDIAPSNENISLLLPEFDQSSADGRYDPFSLQMQSYTNLALKINSNIVNMPYVPKLFRLNRPNSFPVFKDLYDIICDIRASNIDEPLDESAFIKLLEKKLYSPDTKFSINNLKAIQMLTKLENPNTNLDPNDFQDFDLHNEAVKDLLRNSDFKDLVQTLIKPKKIDEEVDADESLKKIIEAPASAPSQNNIVVQKVGRLRSYETQYLLNPLNTKNLIQSKKVDLNKFYTDFEGLSYKDNERLVVLLVNPKDSHCFNDNLKLFFDQ